MSREANTVMRALTLPPRVASRDHEAALLQQAEEASRVRYGLLPATTPSSSLCTMAASCEPLCHFGGRCVSSATLVAAVHCG